MTNFNLKQYLSEGKLLQEIKVNKPGTYYFKNWKLGYPTDSIIQIRPINNSRSTITGRVHGDEVLLWAEGDDLEGIKFLKDLGNELNSEPELGMYNTIRLEVSEQDLQNLLYFKDND